MSGSSCQVVIKQQLNKCQAVVVKQSLKVRQSSGSRQVVVRQSSGSRQPLHFQVQFFFSAKLLVVTGYTTNLSQGKHSEVIDLYDEDNNCQMTVQADYPLEVMQATGALLKFNDQQEEIIICGGIDLTTTTDKEREIMKKVKESGKKPLCIIPELRLCNQLRKSLKEIAVS